MANPVPEPPASPTATPAKPSEAQAAALAASLPGWDALPEDTRRLFHEAAFPSAAPATNGLSAAAASRSGRFGPAGEPLDLPALAAAAQARQPALRTELARKAAEAKARVDAYRRQTGLPETADLPDGRRALLTDVRDGQPFYIATTNANAAKTVAADRLWPATAGLPMGSTGLNLDGTGVTFGIWDGGDVSPTHPEFALPGGQSRVTDGDGTSVLSETDTNHANHVAGTMAAAGVVGQARGIAWRANLKSWLFTNVFTKMAEAAAPPLQFDEDNNPLPRPPPLRLSNHSYGPASYGWTGLFSFGTFGQRWAWNADPTAYPPGTPLSQVKEDWQFGFYTEDSRDLDDVIHTNPRFLTVYAAGNERTGNEAAGYPSLDGYDPAPPGRGYVFRRLNGSSFVIELRSFTIPNIYSELWAPPTDGDEDWDFIYDEDNDGETDLYDTLGDYAVAKNNLVVGSVADLPNGWVAGTGFNKVSDFASFGPPDDGRVKPDLTANGEVLLSSTLHAKNAADPDPLYGEDSGTSMAAPGVTGSLGLVLQLWRQLRPGQEDPLASTFKALAIGSADEIGPNPGPDYRAGWGLFNAARAAETLRLNAFSGDSAFVRELALLPGETWQADVLVRGTLWPDQQRRLRATAVWTDPPGTVLPKGVDNRAPMLVNDVDLRVVLPGLDGTLGTVDDVTVLPWKLNPNNPAAAATRGDNTVDNVEQVDALGSLPGTKARLVLSRKAGGTHGAQAVSLVVNGAMPPPRATALNTLPNDRVDLGWPSSPGADYLIEHATSMVAPVAWSPVQTVTAVEPFTVLNLAVPPGSETHFWRVREVQP